MLLHIKKNYFMHLCCLLLKSSKVFSVPLKEGSVKGKQKKATFDWQWRRRGKEEERFKEKGRKSRKGNLSYTRT